jgi:hypothetical protein
MMDASQQWGKVVLQKGSEEKGDLTELEFK